MVSLKSSIGAKKRAGRVRLRRRASSGAVALEFAILAIPFFMWILYIFELSYDLFTQQALDFALHAAVRQIQTGHAQNLASGGAFISSDFCGATKGLLECNNNNVWIKVQATSTYPAQSSGAGNTASNPLDYSSLTNGAVPMKGNVLDLSQYTSIGGAATGTSGSSGSSTTQVIPFCNASGSQAILVSAIYIGPSFISGLLPGVLSAEYNGNTVHATLSTAGFVTEPFTSTQNPNGGGGGTSTVAPSC